MVTVNAPDGRPWEVIRRTEPPSVVAGLLPGARWVVEARSGDERRLWEASSRAAAGQLRTQIALALRTGAEGPPGEHEAPAETGGADRAGADQDPDAPSG